MFSLYITKLRKHRNITENIIFLVEQRERLPLISLAFFFNILKRN